MTSSTRQSHCSSPCSVRRSIGGGGGDDVWFDEPLAGPTTATPPSLAVATPTSGADKTRVDNVGDGAHGDRRTKPNGGHYSLENNHQSVPSPNTATATTETHTTAIQQQPMPTQQHNQTIHNPNIDSHPGYNDSRAAHKPIAAMRPRETIATMEAYSESRVRVSLAVPEVVSSSASSSSTTSSSACSPDDKPMTTTSASNNEPAAVADALPNASATANNGSLSNRWRSWRPSVFQCCYTNEKNLQSG